MDMESSHENLERFKKEINSPVYPISAATGEGIDEVIIKLADMLDKIEKQPLYEEEKFESHVLYKFNKEKPYTIEKDNDVYVIKGKEVEKLLRMTWFSSGESASRFSKKLEKLGIDKELKEMGIKEGDTIRILDYELEYKD
jgi:GTP-binding protein